MNELVLHLGFIGPLVCRLRLSSRSRSNINIIIIIIIIIISSSISSSISNICSNKQDSRLLIASAIVLVAPISELDN